MQPNSSGPSTPSNPQGPVVYPSAGTPPPPPGAGAPAQPHGFTPNSAPSKKPTKRRLLMLAGTTFIFAAALATYAFAYYLPNKPENVWKSALSNTSKGYDRLTEYTSSDELKKQYEKGSQVDGSYEVTSGDVTTDGSFNILSDDKSNATFSADLGLGVSRLEVSGIAKKSSTSEFPDLYVKVDGITGFGDLFGLPQLDNLNDKWISIDHTLVDMAIPEEGGTPALTEKDMNEVVDVFGKVSDKYIFTTEPENAAFSVKEYVGEEKQDGKTTMHYKISPNKSNFKRFLAELSTELDKTEFNKWFEKTYSKPLSEAIAIEKAADNLKGSETFDAWVNKDTKLLHKLRFTDSKQPKKKYAELMFNYDGGSKMPFSFKVAGTEDNEDTILDLDVTLDTDSHTFTLKGDLDTTSDGQNTKMAIDATIKPSDKAVSVEIPEGALSLAQAMQALGFGDYINNLESSLQNLESL